MALDLQKLESVAKDYDQKDPADIIRLAIEEYSPSLAISFSGAEDVVLVDMACKIGGDFRVFSLDTGRLHPETYELLDRVRERYEIDLEVFFPEPGAVEDLVKAKGLYSFRKDGHKECCGVRKVEPLTRALKPLDGWVTGQRKDQSPGTRASVPVVQNDGMFGSPDSPLVKFNPLANWTSQQVWDYIRQNDVPYNSLHDRGFVSIGCEPCTRPVGPGEHERAGRWWWEEATQKECGLHASNLREAS